MIEYLTEEDELTLGNIVKGLQETSIAQTIAQTNAKSFFKSIQNKFPKHENEILKEIERKMPKTLPSQIWRDMINMKPKEFVLHYKENEEIYKNTSPEFSYDLNKDKNLAAYAGHIYYFPENDYHAFSKIQKYVMCCKITEDSLLMVNKDGLLLKFAIEDFISSENSLLSSTQLFQFL